MHPRFHAVFLAAALAAGLGAQSAFTINLGGGCPGPSAPQLSITDPLLGGTATISLTSPFPHAPGALFVSFGPPGNSQVGSCTLRMNPVFTVLTGFVTDANGSYSLTVPVPAFAPLAGLRLVFQAILWADKNLSNAVEVQLGTSGVCLLIIDEDTIDNGISSIVNAAASHSVTPDLLVNDDRPTETGNPWLRWNELFPGDVVVLPGGRVDDEGLFALPPLPPFAIADFVAGTVPQSQLDPVPDVMPLRNHELAAMRGQTCVAVVYDSDISMNYLPIQGNLQGARYGLFAFTVLDVVVPGGIPESGSSTSLYDLLIRVEPPITPGAPMQVVIRDHEPDSIQLTRARQSGGVLQVWGTSNFAPGAQMTVSVEGLVFEAPMTWNGAAGRYEYVTPAGPEVRGRRVTISTDEGGAYNDRIE